MITQEQYDKEKELIIDQLAELFPQLERYEVMTLYDIVSLIANLQIRLTMQYLAEPNNKINP